MSELYWIIGGVLLLITGRKLYWLFVAIVGFIVGLTLSMTYLELDPIWVYWLIAIGCGVLSGFLAIALQRLMVGAAGFITGGYALVFILDLIGIELGDIRWLFYLVGGVIGAVLVLVVFEYALIVLSSVAGAMLISRSFNFPPGLATAAFLALVLLGFLMQWAGLRAENKAEAS
jgi:hypothetical protein